MALPLQQYVLVGSVTLIFRRRRRLHGNPFRTQAQFRRRFNRGARAWRACRRRRRRLLERGRERECAGGVEWIITQS